jgi:hypothetical protein
MPSRFSIGIQDPRKLELARTVAQIASIWIVSDLGYYLLLPALGLQPSYNSGSIAIALYYVFWTGIAVITFWPLYSRWITFESRFASYIVWSLAFIGCTLFAAYLLPLLPTTKWMQAWTPPEVAVATPWYFLPKSIDILFQQLLVVALVLVLSDQRYSLRCAVLFGGTHVLLAFGGVPFGYVLRFMLAAAAFGLLFPFLILRVPNGLAYSYMVHWVYYAITVSMPRIFSQAAA